MGLLLREVLAWLSRRFPPPRPETATVVGSWRCCENNWRYISDAGSSMLVHCLCGRSAEIVAVPPS